MAMELVSNLFVIASLAVLLSFLVAKLVSFAIAGDPHPPRHRHPHGATKTAREAIILQKVRSGSPEPLTVQSAQTQSESKVEFLGPIEVTRNVEIEHRVREIAVEPESHVAELPVEESNIAPALFNVDASTEDSVEGKTKEAVGSASLDDPAKQRNTECVEEISSMHPSTEMGISGESVVESGIKERDVEREVALDFEDDDDWEGIERSELEKVFMAAAEFVVGNGSGNEGDRLASVGSDVQMELYGLHKVATEGPCREPQPMPLKLSARAKWNAWQKLGNMSPEVAMEQYINLLSDKVPEWKKDDSARKSVQESTGSQVFQLTAPDLSTSLSHQQIVITEREHEQECGVQDHSPPAVSELENNVKK